MNQLINILIKALKPYRSKIGRLYRWLGWLVLRPAAERQKIILRLKKLLKLSNVKLVDLDVVKLGCQGELKYIVKVKIDCFCCQKRKTEIYNLRLVDYLEPHIKKLACSDCLDPALYS